jgi:hypothetical protein
MSRICLQDRKWSLVYLGLGQSTDSQLKSRLSGHRTEQTAMEGLPSSWEYRFALDVRRGDPSS